MTPKTEQRLRYVAITIIVINAVALAVLYLRRRHTHEIDLCTVAAIVSTVPFGEAKEVSIQRHTRISFGCIAPGDHDRWLLITSITDGQSLAYTYIPKSLVLKIYYFKVARGKEDP